MRYTLTGATATLALTVANTGSKDLPFSVGFHPYFAASNLDNVRFDIQAATCSEDAKGEQPAAPETITLTRKPGSADSIRLLTGVKSPMVFTDGAMVTRSRWPLTRRPSARACSGSRMPSALSAWNPGTAGPTR